MSAPLDLHEFFAALQHHGCDPKWRGSKIVSRCPAHDDRTPSLNAEKGDRQPVVAWCGAGCKWDQMLAALDLDKRRNGRQRRITLKELAELKRLPVEFLKGLGWRDVRGGIEIPYRMMDGTPAPRSKKRWGRTATDGSCWLPKGEGASPVPLGLDRLAKAREAGRAVAVEGETDWATLAFHGFPAIGIPGADMAGKLESEHVEGIDRLYVVREPDKGGDIFVPGIASRLRALGWAGQAFEVTLNGHKDPSDLHIANPDGFKAAFEAALGAAAPLTLEPRPTPAPAEDELPAVLTPGAHLDDEGEYTEIGNDDFAREVLRAIPEGVLFMRGDVLGEISGDKFKAIIEARARAVIDHYVRLMFWKSAPKKSPERIYTPATRDHAQIVIASAGKGGNGPATLTGITPSPTMRRDGSIIVRPGYDRATGLYYDPRGVEFPPIPDRPSLENARAALVELAAPFSEFCYVDQNIGLAVVVSAILTLNARPAIDGACPLFAIDSTTAGSGKDLLMSAACIIGMGREPKRDTPPTGSHAGEEWRKMILTYATDSAPSVALCNIDRPLGAGPFDEALTGPSTSGRHMGFTRSAEAPLTIVWWAVGNNLRFIGDLARRVVPINLDPRVEDPDKRTGPAPGKRWTHADDELKSYVRQERPRLVSEALTLLRAFHLAGRPGHGKAPLGSFTSWDRWIRAAVIWAGGADPLAGCESVRRESDTTRDALRAALLIWHSTFCNETFTASEVIAETKGNPELLTALTELAGCDAAKLDPRRLGHALRRTKGRTVAGLRFVRGGQDYKAKIAKWRVEGEPE